MASLKNGKEIYSNGLRFTYFATKTYAEICVWSATGTHNFIDSWTVEINTVQDFEIQVAFWLYENGLL